MEIKVNGELRSYSGPATVGGLLRFLGVSHNSVAVERNLRIIARGEIEAEPLAPGDELEIIRLVGGG